ncbi:uncharacterized protein LOC136085290 [Hydra vulgaris]|uniref:Uncharacterized protein LOC136085290 n=1 Tax=Hydra vulgaris TaxID=6087 RepID=A0ABM4CLJ3_HYDVU
MIYELDESYTLHLLGLTLTSNLSWKPYIKSVAKLASAKVASLYRARHFFTSDSILYFYKSQIRPCMEYCCHIWGGSSNDALSLCKIRIVGIVGRALAANLQPLSHCRNVASLSLFYKYYNEHCSKELESLVPFTKIHYRVTPHSIKCHPFSVTVPKCSKNAYSSSFFPRTSAIWNSLSSSSFPDSYNLQSFKSSVKLYLALQSSSFFFQ